MGTCGGTQQVLLLDITNVKPWNKWGAHEVRMDIAGHESLQLHVKNKQDTFDIASKIEEAMMS